MLAVTLFFFEEYEIKNLFAIENNLHYVVDKFFIREKYKLCTKTEYVITVEIIHV